MILSSAKIFLPWLIFFALIQGLGVHVKPASLLSFGLFIVIGLGDLKQGYILNWLSFCLFAVVTLNASFIHYPLDRVYVSASFYSLLSLVAWGSLAIKKPFTLQYARKMVSAQAWKSPLFLRVNSILTLCWAIIFTINFCIMLLPLNVFWIQYLCAMILNGVGIVIVAVFPKWYTTNPRNNGLGKL